MKRIFLTILALALFIPMAYGADVEITITIPDAYVARLQAAVANIECTQEETIQVEVPILDEFGQPTGETQMVDQVVTSTLNPKACLTRKIINELKAFVKMTEERDAVIAAKDAYDTLLEQWLENYDDLGVE